MQVDIDSIIKKYVELRDAIDAVNAEAKKKVAALEEAQETIASVLMKLAKEQGVTSFKTESGTAFVSTKDHVGISDWNRTIEYIEQNKAWNLLNKAVNKTAVKEYIAQHEIPPPGVNYTVMQEIQVRRK